MRVAIVGFGAEGESLYEFLKKSPTYKDAEIWALDRDLKLKKTLKALGIPHALGERYLSTLSDFNVVFRSPGVPYLTPEIQKARKAGVKISSQTKLFFEEVATFREKTHGAKPVLIGVTGSKGKGTTCTLIFRMLKAGKYRTVLLGNIGSPMIAALPTAKRADYVVLELSSFQLQDMERSPDIAVVLDIFPEHLDVHKDLAEYYTAKENIGRFQKRTDRIFFFSTNAKSKRIASKSPAKQHPVTPKSDNLKKNIEMASAVARVCGVSNTVIEKTVKGFTGLEHRLELVRKIQSITFYNDSASTNPVSAAAAALSFKEPSVMIIGGKDKGLDYAPLSSAIKKSSVAHIVLFGENRDKISDELAKTKRTIVFAENLKEAVACAYIRAKELARDNESAAVIFSPASASFDMFKNYKDRGEKYKKAVNSLK